MNEKIYSIYLKESPLGLKYLGITISNPYKYCGSGLIWTKHLRENNISRKSIITKVLYQSNIRENAEEKGKYYSNLWNIVKNPEFANLILETGYGGRLLELSEKSRLAILESIRRKVNQYDLDGNFIRTFDSMKEAGIFTGSQKSYISKCCRNLAFSSKGYRYSYLDSKLNLDINCRYKVHKKKVYQYTKGLQFVKEWNCVADAARFYKTPDTNIFSVVKNKTKSAKGYYWTYKKI